MDLTEVFDRLRHRERAPRAFDAERRGLPWEDPAFSRAFYELHTRDDEDTRVEVDACARWLKLVRGQRVLDLGCGGGRTLEALAERGIFGAGIDIGPWPAKVAREALASYPVEILEGDMRTELPEGPFDAALCLFGQLTTFPEADALTILRRAAGALGPGGQILLELYLGPALLDAVDGMESWTVTDRWMGGEYPQLLLDEHHVDLDAAEYVRTTWVVAMGDKGPPLQRFVQGSEVYDEARLADLLGRAGFYITALFGDWEGSVFDEDSINLIAVARLLG